MARWKFGHFKLVSKMSRKLFVLGAWTWSADGGWWVDYLIIPPAYEVYRGYIVFVFSVIVCVCVCVNFFFIKDFSELLNLGFWNLVQLLSITCCIVQERISLLLLIILFIYPFFFLSNKNFCHRFYSFYESQSLQILYTPWEWPNILWEKKHQDAEINFCLLFPFFHLSLLV